MRRMAMTEYECVSKVVEILYRALVPFVERQLESAWGKHWRAKATMKIDGLKLDCERNPNWDLAKLLKAMDRFWGKAFHSSRLGPDERSIVKKLIRVRNEHAHNESFSRDDAMRALDSARRLLSAIEAEDCVRQLGDLREKYTGVLTCAKPERAPRPVSSACRASETPRTFTRETLRAKQTKGPPRTEPERAPPPVSRPHPPCEPSPTFTQDMFRAELSRMLDEERAAGKSTCRIVSRDLHRRVVGGSQPNRMPQACNAMWALWERQGSHRDRIVRTTRSGQSTTIEIEYVLR